MDIIYFVGGLLLLLLGADSAVKSLAGLQKTAGASAYLAGLVVVAVMTCLPELAISAQAVAAGQPQLALGNAMGSNVVNLGLMLGVAAAASTLQISMRLLGQALIMLLVACGALLVLGFDGQLRRWEGAVLIGSYGLFLLFFLTRAKAEHEAVQVQFIDMADTQTGWDRNLLRLLVGAALLFFGARWVVTAALPIGAMLGFAPLLTGLIVVAVASAIPEIILAVVAARAGHGNVVLGSIVCACMFNVLFLVGGIALWQPLLFPVSLIGLELPATMAFALALYPMLGGDSQIDRREGAILITLFVAWLIYQLALAWS